jgi:hypothetical protein
VIACNFFARKLFRSPDMSTIHACKSALDSNERGQQKILPFGFNEDNMAFI